MAQRHLIRIGNLTTEQIQNVIGLALAEKKLRKLKPFRALTGQTLGLFFLEPSTRTRVSFELAAQSLGMKTFLVESKGSSFEKEESLEDGLGVAVALGVRHFVVRSPERGSLDVLARQKDLVLLNAGDGAGEHPSQALLDAATMCSDLRIKSVKGLRGKTLGILGDIRRSRVARSWVELAARLGIDLRLIAPEAWQPTDFAQTAQRVTKKLKALSDLDFLLCLRVQKERMSAIEQGQVENFVDQFQVQQSDLKGTRFKILHPGPVNWGVELSTSLRGHERSLIDEQLKMSIHVRRNLLILLNKTKT